MGWEGRFALVWLWVGLASAALAQNLLLNGSFEEQPILGAGQTVVPSGGTKLICTLTSDTRYANGIFGIRSWTTGEFLAGQGWVDVGLTRAASPGPTGGTQYAFGNNWNARLSQVTRHVLRAGDQITVSLRVGSAVSAARAGRVQLLAGGVNPSNPNQLAPGTLVLAEGTAGTTQYTAAPLNAVMPGVGWARLTVRFTVPNGSPAIGKPLAVSIFTLTNSVGLVYYDDVDLRVTPREAVNPVITLVAGNIYPPTTEFNQAAVLTSRSGDPLDLFNGIPVNFLGTTGSGIQPTFNGAPRVYSFRLTFSQPTTLRRILIRGDAFNGNRFLRLSNFNGTQEWAYVTPIAGDGVRTFIWELPSGISGTDFFLQEYESSTVWRYRDLIRVEYDGDATMTPSLLGSVPTRPAGSTVNQSVFFRSDSTDPTDVFRQRGILFRGWNQSGPNQQTAGGNFLVYRYRIEYPEPVVFQSFQVDGVAFFWNNRQIRVYDGNGVLLAWQATSGDNSTSWPLPSFTAAGTRMASRVFFVEEYDGSSEYRYRNNFRFNVTQLQDPSPAEVFFSGTGNGYTPVSVPTGISWEMARDAAHLQGAALASITTPEENQFVFSVIDRADMWRMLPNLNSSGPFFGLFQPPGSPEPAGGWSWLSGEPFLSSAWTSSQPDNFDGSQNVARFHAPSSGPPRTSQWDDDFSDPDPLFRTTSYIMERTPSSEGNTVANAKALPAGAQVLLEDVKVISTVDMINSTAFKSFHVEDASGGLTVFGTNAVIDPILAQISVGDRITIRGVTGINNGTSQIGPPLSLEDVEPGAGQPVVEQWTVPWYLLDFSPYAESLESRIVRLPGVTFNQTGVFAGLTNYTVTLGGNTITVRVPTTFNDLVGVTIPSGPVTLRGVVQQFDATAPFDASYQVYLRGRSDILIGGPTLSMAFQLPNLVPALSSAVIRAEIRQRGTNSLLASQSRQLNANGNALFDFLGLVPAGTYHLRFSTPGYLARWIPNVVIGASPLSPNVATLVPGDVNGDDQIDLTDLDLTIASYGTAPGDRDHVPGSDINRDTEVDLTDLDLVIQNYGVSSNEP